MREAMTPTARILIVDDDVETRELLAEEVQDLGHEAICAADGVQALSQVWRERPDLIVLDLRLPGGDGFSVLERLRHIPDIAFIPVIVFSGMHSTELEERAQLLGAREFVHKSFHGDHLVDAIARALDRGAEPELPALRLSERGVGAVALALTLAGDGGVIPTQAEGSGWDASPPLSPKLARATA
jgi:CheY-like chemotaxis protein